MPQYNDIIFELTASKPKNISLDDFDKLETVATNWKDLGYDLVTGYVEGDKDATRIFISKPE